MAYKSTKGLFYLTWAFCGLFGLFALPVAGQTGDVIILDLDPSCDPESDGRVSISPTNIDFYETSCTILHAEAIEGQVNAVALCSGEGDEWRRDFRIQPSHTGIAIDFKDDDGEAGRSEYYRC